MGVLEQGQSLVGDEWKRHVDNSIDGHMERLDKGDERFDRLERKLDANNASTDRIEQNTSAILEIFEAFRGFAKVGGWVGGTIKWVAALVVAIGIVVYFFKTGDLPRKP